MSKDVAVVNLLRYCALAEERHWWVPNKNEEELAGYD